MRLVDLPHIYPAVSILGHAHGPVVDTECEMLAGGRVYINQTEASEIARLFGFDPPMEAKRKAARIKLLEDELAEALTMVDRVRRNVLAAA